MAPEFKSKGERLV